MGNSQTDKFLSKQSIQSLQEEVAQLKRLLRESEEKSTEAKLTMRTLCHDLVNPLQILSMSLEVMLEKSPAEPILERMKRATDKLEKHILEARQIALLSDKSTPYV